MLLGLRLPGVAGETCTLTTHGAATKVALDGGLTPGHSRYPLIRWDVVLTQGDDAAPACTRHPLDGSAEGVATAYTPLTAPRAFAYELGDTILRLGGFPAALGFTEHSPSLGARHTIDGLFTGYPDPTHGWTGAVPRLDPDAERFYFEYDGQWLAGILEGFTCPAALDDDEGVTLAIATEGGQVGWLLYATPQGLVSALRDGVDVTEQGSPRPGSPSRRARTHPRAPLPHRVRGPGRARRLQLPRRRRGRPLRAALVDALHLRRLRAGRRDPAAPPRRARDRHPARAGRRRRRREGPRRLRLGRVSGQGFAAVSANGTATTLYTAEPYWGGPTTGLGGWTLWRSLCGGHNNCAQRACPALRPYDGYPCHYDFWAPKFLFAR